MEPFDEYARSEYESPADALQTHHAFLDDISSANTPAANSGASCETHAAGFHDLSPEVELTSLPFSCQDEDRSKRWKGFQLDAANGMQLNGLGLKEGGQLFKREYQKDPPVDTAKTTELIAQLDNDDFETRQAAAKKLEQLGPRALPLLAEKLKEATDADKAKWLRDIHDTLKNNLDERLKRLLPDTGGNWFDSEGRISLLNIGENIGALQFGYDSTDATMPNSISIRQFDHQQPGVIAHTLNLSRQPDGSYSSDNGLKDITSIEIRRHGPLPEDPPSTILELKDRDGRIVRALEFYFYG